MYSNQFYHFLQREPNPKTNNVLFLSSPLTNPHYRYAEIIANASF